MNLSLTRTSLLFDLQFLILTFLVRIQQHRRSVLLPGKKFSQPECVIVKFVLFNYVLFSYSIFCLVQRNIHDFCFVVAIILWIVVP